MCGINYKIVSHIISQHIRTEPDFMVTTATGFQCIRSTEILYFEYSKTKKLWKTVLTNNTCLQLKRIIAANDILTYSSSFIRINTQHIINLNHLVKIDERKCVMSIYSGDTELTISRNCLKELREKIMVL